jgi:hypothetical protein
MCICCIDTSQWLGKHVPVAPNKKQQQNLFLNPSTVAIYSEENLLLARRMVSSGMLGRVVLVRTDVSEELRASRRRNIPEDTILHSHHRENLKSYILLACLHNQKNIGRTRLGIAPPPNHDGFLPSHTKFIQSKYTAWTLIHSFPDSPMALQAFVGLWPLSQFRNPINIRTCSFDGDQAVARPQPTDRTKTNSVSLSPQANYTD